MKARERDGDRRLCLVANTSWYLSNFVTPLIRRLISSGERLRVLSGPDATQAKLRGVGCETESLRVDSRGTNLAKDLRLFLRLRRVLRRTAPDLCLLFTIKPNLYGALAAGSLGIPTICTVSGLGSGFSRSPMLRRLLGIAHRVAFRFVDRVIFLNASDRDYFLENRIVPPDKISLLPGPGIDTDFFAPRPKHAENGECVFLMLGRLLWEKGVQEYIEAAQGLRGNGGPRIDCRLLGFPAVLPSCGLTGEAIYAGATGNVAYLGATDDVRPYIAEADCVVLPSFYGEGLSRTLLESLSMERPIITTTIPGCAELVQCEKSGIMVRPRDVTALTDAMRRMANKSKSERRLMGKTGRMMVATQFDSRIVTTCYLREIARVLRKRRGRRIGAPDQSAGG